VPGFIDIHIHGAGGHDVMEGEAGALATVASAVARHGTTSLLATTLTASTEQTCRSLEGIARYIEKQPGRRGNSPAADFLGIHLEGPFLNPARRGAHPSDWIAPPSVEVLGRFLDAAAGCAKILTLAPEVPGALTLVEHACKSGLVVGRGHTDATFEQAREAIRRGARHAVHVFNAMRPFSHRETGVIGAVLTAPEVSAELIADGIHVDAAAIKILLAAKGFERVVLVSDATSATGMPDGQYRLGPLQVTVTGGVCRNAADRLAGSTLTLDRALRNIVGLGVPLEHALAMLTLNPARVLGLERRKGVLAPGADADLLLLDPELRVRGVMSRGAGLG
jgi:N-acetylglucosamine-6-phosphate deacetylase